MREIAKSSATTQQIEENLKGISVDFKFKGGAKTSFLWEDLPQPFYDIIVIAIGSNNLTQMDPQELFNGLNFHADRYLKNHWCRAVVIMGLWPQANSEFNLRMRAFNSLKSIR